MQGAAFRAGCQAARVLVAPLVLMLVAGCAGKVPAVVHPVALAELAEDPDRFYGEEVKVAGFFNREWLIPAEAGGCNPGPDHGRQLYLRLRTEDNLRVADLQFRWITVSGTLAEPRDLRLGGGDLVITIPAEGMLAIVEKAKVEAVDQDRTCQPG